jgi:hypothetical protein
MYANYDRHLQSIQQRPVSCLISPEEHRKPLYGPVGPSGSRRDLQKAFEFCSKQEGEINKEQIHQRQSSHNWDRV